MKIQSPVITGSLQLESIPQGSTETRILVIDTTGSVFYRTDVGGSDPFPYTGSARITGSLVLTGSLLVTQSYISTVDYIDFTLTADPAHNEGRIHWIDDTKTLNLDTDVNNFYVELGHQNVVRVNNQNSFALTKGTVVYINGENGQRPTVATASFENDALSAATLGLVAQNINSGQNGYVVSSGIIRGINTNAYAPGTMLYLSSSGQFSSTIPESPLHEVRLGKTITQATDGTIFIDVMNGYELGELHDVLETNRQNGDLIVFDSGSRVYKNSKILSGSYGVSGSLTVSQGITGSLFGTSSYATQALSSSFATSASHALNVSIRTSGSSLYSHNPLTTNFSPTRGIFLGEGAGEYCDADYSNFIGDYAGAAAEGSTSSNFIGYRAGFAAYTSFGSNFIGESAGYYAINARYSNFIGNYAGHEVLDANYSNFIGYFAGGNSAASSSNFIGNEAGNQAYNSHYSNFIGYRAGHQNTFAAYSNFIGWNVGNNNNLGSNNILIGTNIGLPSGSTNRINIAGLIYGTGSYSNTTSPVFSGSANGRIGINQPNPRYSFDVSGSGNYTNGLTVTGSVIATSFTGSLFGTSSWSNNTISSSYAATASFVLNAISSSYAVTSSYTFNAISSSFASTASYVNPLRQDVIVTGSLNVSGSTVIKGGLTVDDANDGDMTFGSRTLSVNNTANPFYISNTNAYGGVIFNYGPSNKNLFGFGGDNDYTNGRIVMGNWGNVNYQNANSSSYDVPYGTFHLYSRTGENAFNITTQGGTANFLAHDKNNIGSLQNISFNTDAVYISSSGNVGFGTATPAEKVHVIGNGLFTGDLTVQGKITAEEFYTEYVSSSVIYRSGSTKFGDTFDDTHQFTGSVTALSFTGSLFGTASYATQALSSSFATTSSFAISSSFGATSLSSSYALTASYALNGGGGGSALSIIDETTNLGTATHLKFEGSGVTATLSNSTASISIPGGGGSAFPYTGSAAITGSLAVTGSTGIRGNLTVSGTLEATIKSFLIDHPTKPGKRLQYGTLEGPEHSVYVRGRLQNGNIIILPDYWNGLIHEDSITVNLTPIGASQNLWVNSITDEYIKIDSDSKNIDCFYSVFAERKDVDKLIVEFDKV